MDVGEDRALTEELRQLRSHGTVGDANDLVQEPARASATTPPRRAARPADPADPLLIGTVSVCALLMLVAGAWALASPSTFADVVGFDRAGEHFLHDAGAFQLGIGAGLFLALIW